MATRDEKIDKWVADAAARGITITREEVEKILEDFEQELVAKGELKPDVPRIPFKPNRAQRRAMDKRDRRNRKVVKK